MFYEVLMDSVTFYDLLNTKKQIFFNQFTSEALLKSIPKIMYMKDLKGAYITGTSYGKKFFETGFDAINNLNLKIEQFRENIQQDDAEVIQSKKSISIEHRISDINGIEHFYFIQKTPLYDDANNVIGIIIMIQNFDNEKILNMQKDTFIATLGHDLKNPTLAQIRAVELLLKDNFGKINDTQREILEMLLDSCKYMSGMLSSMLATFRSDGGVVKLNFDKISLIDLTQECIGEMLYIAKNKDVNILLDTACEIPYVYGDKIQIKRVVMNLLSNGIKYAFTKSNLKICVYNEGDYTCFKFQNNSPYMSPEKQKSIFARYVSFAEAHKELGIGLGLYASKRIIDAHNGEIFVKSFKNNINEFGFKISHKLPDLTKNYEVVF